MKFGLWIFDLLNLYPYIHIHIHTHTYTHTYTHTLTHIHTHIHTYTLTYIHTHIHTHLLTYTLTHTHTLTHTYTYTHMHTQKIFLSESLLNFLILSFGVRQSCKTVWLCVTSKSYRVCHGFRYRLSEIIIFVSF